MELTTSRLIPSDYVAHVLVFNSLIIQHKTILFNTQTGGQRKETEMPLQSNIDNLGHFPLRVHNANAGSAASAPLEGIRQIAHPNDRLTHN